jgi:hypothetical protein
MVIAARVSRGPFKPVDAREGIPTDPARWASSPSPTGRPPRPGSASTRLAALMLLRGEARVAQMTPRPRLIVIDSIAEDLLEREPSSI